MSGMTGDRRSFLAQAGGLLTVPLLGGVLVEGAAARVRRVAAAAAGRSPEEVAADEDFWFPVQQAFAVDRSLINLNNGGVSPAPESVMSAVRRHDAYSNHAPAKTAWRDLRPSVENVRTRLAASFGADREEIAIVRNATEALDNVLFGVDLAPGDEVVTTDQDYGSMLSALEHRVARHGIVLKKVKPPTPSPSADALVRIFAEALTDRTKLVLVCHVVNLTGQIFPIREICRIAHARGVRVLVDGAHSFAHFPFTRDDLDCDFFGTSLHKWLNAPIGSGMLYVKREHVKGLWPLFGQLAVGADDVRKFESYGTYPVGDRLAIAEALTFHEALGADRKAARLRYLRDRWVERLKDDPRVRLHAAPNDVDSCAIATVGVEGVDSGALGRHLMRAHRIVTTTIGHEDVDGVRVTPGIYTTLREVDLFADAMLHVLEHGIDES